MAGIVTNLFIKTEHKQPVQPQQQLSLKEKFGIIGDIHANPLNPRHVLIIDKSILDFYQLQPGALKENITTQNIDLSKIESGTLIKIGSTKIRINFDCEPCGFVESLQQGLMQKIEGNRGILGYVLEGGTVKIGDSIEILKTSYERIPYKIPERFVWMMEKVPYGKVITYRSIIESLGLFSAYYRVIPTYIKRHLGSNLPLHRILDSEGALNEYVPNQAEKLMAESVAVLDGKVVDKSYYWDLSGLYLA